MNRYKTKYKGLFICTEMSQTALIVEVPEAEAVVGNLRTRFDGVSLLGMPAHITVLYPFIEKQELTEPIRKRIAEVVSGVMKFGFQLCELGEFPETVYLAPSPKADFIQLTEAIAREFPDYPPFGGIHDSVIPHLSVLNGNKKYVKEVKAALESSLELNDGIRSNCVEVALFGFDNARWEKLDVFKLS